LAPSVHGLQSLLDICDLELSFLNMSVNARKSVCIRFGRNYSRVCDNMVVAGNVVNWVTSSRYLEVHLQS